MPQVAYRRPYNIWLFAAVLFGLVITFIVLLFILGRSSVVPWVILGIALVLGATGVLFDPETCYTSSGVLENGRQIKVKRPLIGFKSCEVAYGVTGGYDVSYTDGYRHEQAIFRI